MEKVEIFNDKRIPLNKIEERYNINENEYKQSVHIWIMNNNREFLIQKRSPNKRSFPNMWSITGGATQIGETTLETVIRECQEELAINVNIDNLELMMSLKLKKDFTDIWLLKQDIDIENIILQEEEVSEAKFVTLDDLEKMIENNEFAPNIVVYYDLIKNYLN